MRFPGKAELMGGGQVAPQSLCLCVRAMSVCTLGFSVSFSAQWAGG